MDQNNLALVNTILSGVLGLILGGGGIGIIVVAIINKKAKSPTDRLEEAKFFEERTQRRIKEYQDDRAEAIKDKEVHRQTAERLEEEIEELKEKARVDWNKESEYLEKIRELEHFKATVQERENAKDEIIRRKDLRILELETRLDNIARKVNRGELPTLRDVLGDEAEAFEGTGIDEDTIRVA